MIWLDSLIRFIFFGVRTGARDHINIMSTHIQWLHRVCIYVNSMCNFGSWIKKTRYVCVETGKPDGWTVNMVLLSWMRARVSMSIQMLPTSNDILIVSADSIRQASTNDNNATSNVTMFKTNRRVMLAHVDTFGGDLSAFFNSRLPIFHAHGGEHLTFKKVISAMHLPQDTGTLDIALDDMTELLFHPGSIVEW